MSVLRWCGSRRMASYWCLHLIPGTYDHITWWGKGQKRMRWQMELRLLISWLCVGEINLDSPGGPHAITGVLKCRQEAGGAESEQCGKDWPSQFWLGRLRKGSCTKQVQKASQSWGRKHRLPWNLKNTVLPKFLFQPIETQFRIVTFDTMLF